MRNKVITYAVKVKYWNRRAIGTCYETTDPNDAYRHMAIACKNFPKNTYYVVETR